MLVVLQVKTFEGISYIIFFKKKLADSKILI